MSISTEREPVFQLLRVRGRTYRQAVIPLPHGASDNLEVEEAVGEDDEIHTSREPGAFQEEKIVDHGLNVQQEDSGTYVLRVQVNPVFYPFIIGKGGQALKQLQADTNCRVSVPRKQDKSKELVFRGANESAVVSAKTRVDITIAAAQLSLRPTHFLSFPMCLKGANPELAKRFEDFRAKVIGGDTPVAQLEQEKIDESVFQRPARLHFTLCVLKLYDPDSVERAKTALREAAASIYDATGTTCVVPHIAGVEIMNDDPTAAHVAYGKPALDQQHTKMQRIAKVAVEALQRHGLLSESDIERDRLLDAQTREGSVKFHMTLMNSKFRSRQDGDARGGRRPHREKRIAMNLQRVMSQLGSFDFGSHRIEALHLSRMAGDDPVTQYYPSELILPLP